MSTSLPPAKKPEALRLSQPAKRDVVQAPERVRVRRGDSLWKLAERHLGGGKHWRKIAAVNPQLSDPNLIRIGEWIRLPQGESNAVAKQVRVQKADSLWKVAQAELGSGQAWSCIAQANPQIQDVNLIYPGQILALPARCSALP